MTTPRRRPIQLDETWHHDLRQLERIIQRDAPTILLGISTLKAELRDAGWPARSPEGDRRTNGGPHTQPPKQRTVWQCCTCSNQFDDWDAFEDHAAPHTLEHQEAEEVTAGHSTGGRAHNDPGGEAAIQLHHRHGDLETMRDHMRAVATSLRALKLIAARHTPDGDKRTEPACWRTNCDGTVEKRISSSTGAVTYRGMTCIDGVWVAKPGEEPVCARHRKAEDRAQVT